MSDLIDRQAAIEALETVGYDFSESELSEVELEEVCGAVSDVRQDMMDRIKQLPPAPPERIKGRWIPSDTDGFVCSVCRNGYRNQPTLMGKPMFEFCPVCGAEMEVTT